MSIEVLLLVIFLVVLPLIEMFRAAAQRRGEQSVPEPPRKPPIRMPQPPHTVQTRIPPEATGISDATVPTVRPDLPEDASPDQGAAAARQALSDAIAARRRTARPRPVANLLPDTAARRDAGTKRGVVRSLRSSAGVHRAVVAMTILGPCRAIDPHAWRDSDTL